MSLIDYIFLPAIICLGIITSYEDIRLNRIRLCLIKWGLLYAVLGHLLLILVGFWGVAGYEGVNGAYIKEYVVNGLVSLVASYSLWKMGGWAAGDAKLFVVFTLLIPLSYYSKGYLSVFPSFALLVNIFIPVFFFIFISTIERLLYITIASFSKKSKNRKFSFSVKEFFKNLIVPAKRKKKEITAKAVAYIFILTVASKVIGRYGINPIIILLIMILFFDSFCKLLIKNKALTIIFAVILLFYFTWETVNQRFAMLLNLFTNIILLLLLFAIVNFLIKIYIKHTQVYKIKVDKLKPKMIVEKDGMDKVILNNEDFKKQLGNIYPDGLLASQVELIKKHQNKLGKDYIEVYRTFSFAIWIFAGVLLTLFLRQNILSFFLNLTGSKITF